MEFQYLYSHTYPVILGYGCSIPSTPGSINNCRTMAEINFPSHSSTPYTTISKTSARYCKSRKIWFQSIPNKPEGRRANYKNDYPSKFPGAHCRHIGHSIPLLTNFDKSGIYALCSIGCQKYSSKFGTQSGQYGFPLSGINNETDIWPGTTTPYIVTWCRLRHDKQANNDNLCSGPSPI